MEVADTLPKILADREALAQVLANLLDNALKYTGEEKRIALRARKDGAVLAFTVEDNGIGIPNDQRRAIFEPFHQVDQRLSRTREGAGLGLAIVRRIVTAHGGEITVAGEPEKGSVFTVKIPLA
jgi:signal transduction histidine kinase